jgi:hypothetical protein
MRPPFGSAWSVAKPDEDPTPLAVAAFAKPRIDLPKGLKAKDSRALVAHLRHDEHIDAAQQARVTPSCASPDRVMVRQGEGTSSISTEGTGKLVATVEEPKKQRTPRLVWAGLLRRTFALDVFACARCSGRCQVLAHLTAPDGGRAILEHLQLPSPPAQLAPARGPPKFLRESHCSTRLDIALPYSFR